VQLALVVVILLAASVLRSYRLADFPPGIEHDEVAEWQIARNILAGQHALFFREAYGQEPAYLYLQAISISLLGDNVFALRFTSFAVAMLTMAACYRLIRRAFGSTAPLASLAFIAVTLWPLFFARAAIRGMTLPLVMCLGADALLSNIKYQTSNIKSRGASRRLQVANWRWVRAGVWFGLAAYTYLAARAIPILLVGFALYLALFVREQMRGKWAGMALMLAIAALIAAPLAVYLWRNPDLQFRVDEVSGPLKQLQQGDPSAVLAGVRDTLLMFSVRGDQTVRDNWPYRPVFADPLSAILFYSGLAVALWRWRKPEYAFTLMWLVTLLMPTMVTAAPPNFVRTLGALPPIFTLPGIGVSTVTDFVNRKDTKIAKAFYIVVLGALAVGLVLTVQDYFVRWPAHDETQFVWQTDLASTAHYLDSARDAPTDVAISGLSNETMDDDSLHLLTQRRDLHIRWFDSRAALIIPSNGGRMFIPNIVPLDPILRARLLDGGAHEYRDPGGRFTWFDLSGVRATGPLTAAVLSNGRPINLGTPLDNGMFLLHCESSNPQVKPGGELTALTYWQATVLPLPPLKAFVHLTDAGGKLIAQSDGLNAPSQFWQPGDVIVQLHRFQIPLNVASGIYLLEAGLYNPQTQARIPFKHAGDHVRLPDVEVKP